MAAGALTIEVPNLASFLKKFEYEPLIAVPYRKGVTKLLLVVEGNARTYAKPHSGDRGELARSIKHELGGVSGTSLSGRVFTDKLYAVPAEYGRKPGAMPPVAAIGDWLRRHGGEESRAYVVARAIGRRGTIGIFYMKRAAEEGQQVAPKIFAEVADDIEKAWASR